MNIYSKRSIRLMLVLLIFQRLSIQFGVLGYFKKTFNLGTGGNFCKVLKHIYSHSKFAVKKDNFMSDFSNYEKGVRQG